MRRAVAIVFVVLTGCAMTEAPERRPILASADAASVTTVSLSDRGLYPHNRTRIRPLTGEAALRIAKALCEGRPPIERPASVAPSMCDLHVVESEREKYALVFVAGRIGGKRVLVDLLGPAYEIDDALAAALAPIDVDRPLAISIGDLPRGLGGVSLRELSSSDVQVHVSLWAGGYDAPREPPRVRIAVVLRNSQELEGTPARAGANAHRTLNYRRHFVVLRDLIAYVRVHVGDEVFELPVPAS